MINQKRICPHCGERVPYAAASCPICGRQCRGRARAAGVRRALLRSGLLLVVFASLVGAALLASNRVLVAERYAAFAAQYLPVGMSSIALTDTEQGAFYYCARCVARRIEQHGSIEMFPSLEHGEVEPLGTGRYQISSFVDEAREGGTTVRRRFSCTVRHSAGRWMLEKLALENGEPREVSELATR